MPKPTDYNEQRQNHTSANAITNSPLSNSTGATETNPPGPTVNLGVTAVKNAVQNAVNTSP